VVRNFIESYRIAGRTARVLTRGPLTEEELIERALRIGEQMFLGGEIERSEAVSQTTIENAIQAFLEQGYLRREGGNLKLAETFAAEDTAATIEAKVASYLLRRSGDAIW
jgi:glycerol-3-phosphate O-acyltransferase